MKKLLVVGRCWKFVEFLIPSIESILKFHDRKDVSIVILENNSSRSEVIKDYCLRLLDGNFIDIYIQANKNLFTNVWHSIPLFRDFLIQHEYISITDLDVNVRGYKNWLFTITDLLRNYGEIGSVTIDVEPMLPASTGFIHIEDVPMSNIPNFWTLAADTGFATSRMSDFINFVNQGGIKGGAFGFHDWLYAHGKLVGRTNIKAYHYGWLRSSPEYREAYKETGIDFDINNLQSNNNQYMHLQGNPPEIDSNTFTVYKK
jgi:hypothetical protein